MTTADLEGMIEGRLSDCVSAPRAHSYLNGRTYLLINELRQPGHRPQDEGFAVFSIEPRRPHDTHTGRAGRPRGSRRARHRKAVLPLFSVESGWANGTNYSRRPSSTRLTAWACWPHRATRSRRSPVTLLSVFT